METGGQDKKISDKAISKLEKVDNIGHRLSLTHVNNVCYCKWNSVGGVRMPLNKLTTELETGGGCWSSWDICMYFRQKMISEM